MRKKKGEGKDEKCTCAHNDSSNTTHLLRGHVQVQRADETHKLMIIEKAIFVIIMLGKLPIQPRHNLIEIPCALGQALCLASLGGVQDMSAFAAALDDNTGAMREVPGDAV